MPVTNCISILPSQRSWAIFPDVGQVLNTLAQHYRLVIASNFDARLHTAMLCNQTFSDTISHIFISSEIGYRKPSIMYYNLIQKQLQCPADQIMMVGDDLINDYNGASASGMVSILYDPKSKYSTIKPSISRLSELIELMPIYDADRP